MRSRICFILILYLIPCLPGTATGAEPEEQSEGKSYLENPEIVLKYDGKEQTAGLTPTGEGDSISAYPSPSGSGIMYVRRDIEPVTISPYQGDYYDARVPATLDLAERGRLAVRAITSIADPEQDYEIFGWIGNIKYGTVIMKHSYHDYNGGQAKWLMQLPLARTMSGDTSNEEVDRGMMETMFRMIGPDGLYYIPAQGASWVGEPDSVEPWTIPGCKQVYDIWPNGRTLLCLVAWLARDPDNEALRTNIDRMIEGFSRIAVRKDNYAYLIRHFYDGKPPETWGLPTGGTAVTSQSTILPGLARYFMLTGDENARALGEEIVRYWLGPAKILKENGDWDYGRGTHFHGTTMILIGLLDWAEATNNNALKQKLSRAYEFGRSFCNPLLGWVPEGLPSVHSNSEPCGIGDMVTLASKLSDYGVGDYWEDVEHFTRNMLAWAQVTDSAWIERVAGGGKPVTRGTNLPTGQTYKPGTPQGLMIKIDGTSGAIRLFYQDGHDENPQCDAWKEFTPGEDPDNLLTARFGPNKLGAGCFIDGKESFQIEHMALYEGNGNIRILSEFDEPAGDMSPSHQGGNIHPGWRFNETEGKQPVAYDGNSVLRMTMNGYWDQYIDTNAPLTAGTDYTLVALFTMPETGGEFVGFTSDGSMSPGGVMRVLKLQDGMITLTNDIWLIGDGHVRRPLESDDDVPRKMIGTFLGMTSPTGHYQTVASHCCTGNGNRGLYFAWRNILRDDGKSLRVNLLLNRASKWADVNSFLPNQGRVDVIMKQKRQLAVRIPSWVQDGDAVTCTVDGVKRSFRRQDSYVHLGKVGRGQTASIHFPLRDETVETKTHWRDLHWYENEKEYSRTYTLRLRGFNVVDIGDRGKEILFPFFSDPAALTEEVSWINLRRFAPDHERFW